MKTLRAMIIVAIIAMVSTTTFAQTKAYVPEDGHCVCVFDDEVDGVYVVLYPKKIQDNYVICDKVGFENDRLVTYVENYPMELGTLFKVNNDGELEINVK